MIGYLYKAFDEGVMSSDFVTMLKILFGIFLLKRGEYVQPNSVRNICFICLFQSKLFLVLVMVGA